MRHIPALALVLFATAALAQTTAPTRISSDDKAPPPSTKPTTTASAATTATPAPPPRPMTGYSYGAPKPASQQPKTSQPRTPRPTPNVPKATGPVATLPGFEMLGDGSSRVFVQLTQSVPVEERKAKGSLTYVLKGAHVTIHNNTNPLVTVHFNTPVSEARLRNAGADLLLVIDLRAPASATWKLTPGKDGTAILQIDFPKGSFSPGPGVAPEKADKG